MTALMASLLPFSFLLFSANAPAYRAMLLHLIPSIDIPKPSAPPQASGFPFNSKTFESAIFRTRLKHLVSRHTLNGYIINDSHGFFKFFTQKAAERISGGSF